MSTEEIKKKTKLSPAQSLVIGIIFVILIGSILLSLPISNNRPIELIDSLFVSTASVCVTGMTPFPIVEQFSVFRTGSNNVINTNRWFTG